MIKTTTTKKRSSDVWHETASDGNAPVLGSMEHPFIVFISKSTLTDTPILGQSFICGQNWCV